MDMTEPGTKEGKVYLKDPEGYEFTIYTDGSGHIVGPNGVPNVNFNTPENSIEYLDKLPQLGNKLNDFEKIAIKTLASSHGLNTTEEYIGKQTKSVPYLGIRENISDQIICTIRKMNNRYMMYQTAAGGGQQQLSSTETWDQFWQAMNVEFAKFAVKFPAPKGSGNANELSESEANAVTQLVGKYMLQPKHSPAGTTTVPYISINANMGSPVWEVRKFEGMYEIINVLGGNHEKFFSEAYFPKLMEKLTELCDKYFGEGATQSSATVEHQGITPEEYTYIRNAVDSYSDAFTTQYNKGTQDSPNPYAVVLTKNYTGNSTLYVTIGAVENYYQINDIANQPVYTNGTLAGILQWLHDKLVSMVGAPKAIPNGDLQDIKELMKGAQFIETSKGSWIYVKEKDQVEVDMHNFVTFTRHRVFGPIRHKPAMMFISWFQSVYAKGEVPPDSNEMASRIINGLTQAGFVNKDTGQVFPQQKINAIKWFRSYVMTITGGECGLAKSKWAIENLETFLAYTAQHGLPPMDTHGPDNSGLFGAIPDPIAPPNFKAEDQTKLTYDEHKKISEIIGAYAPVLKFQIKNDESMLMWVGNKLTSYKIDKGNDTYRIYGEMGGQWEEIYWAKKFEDISNYLSALCQYLMDVLSKSKMSSVNTEPTTTPSTDPDKLSLSEVKILKKLIEQFPNVSIGTYKKKQKLQESKEQQFAQVIISDPSHTMWFRVHKEKEKYVFSRTAEFGKPFTTVKMFDLFGNLVEFIDFYMNGYSTGSPSPEDKAKHNPPILTKEQFDWLENMLAIKKPGVYLKQFGNGVVGGYDPSHKVPGSDIGNPLFVIRPSHPPEKGNITVQVHTADNGMEAEEYPFADFQSMSEWLILNTDTLTQLFSDIPQAWEGHLAEIMDKLGFVYKGVVPGSTGKDWHGYEDNSGQTIYIGPGGSSEISMKDSGHVVVNMFHTLESLVKFLGTIKAGPPQQQSTPKSELKDAQEYLAYLGFNTEYPSHEQGSSMWAKSDEHDAIDHVHLHEDGTSKVTPSAMVAAVAWPSSAFFFNTFQVLKAYLTEKYVKKKDFHDQYFASVLKKGGFKKKDDSDAEIGYVFWHKKLTVVPYSPGGTMYTNVGIDPKIRFSFESTYDLARRVELWIDGDTDYQEPEWSTGNDELNELIDEVGLHYAGSDDYEYGQVLTFMHEDGYKLRFHTSDKSSSFTFAPDPKSKEKAPTIIAFENTQELKEYLQKTIAAQDQGQSIDPPESDKMTSTEILKQSELSYDKDAIDLVTHDLKYLMPAMAESIHFQHSGISGTGEVRALKQNQLLFAIGKKTVGHNMLWYIRQKVSDNKSGLYLEYSFLEKQAMVDWIKAHADPLCSWKSVKGEDGLNIGTPLQPSTGTPAAVQPPKSKSKKTKTGDVPFSGTDYANEFKNFTSYSSHHLTNDHSVMMKMGFNSKFGQAADGVKTEYYEHTKTKDVVYFFGDGHAGVFPENKTSQAESFKNVKDCLQYLWDKYMPHI